ncbi:G-protein coupled receptor 143-like [Hyla sarda]|uniref:G-protein coupled receptor 143-like n=1 Tax=Hyla sarda TaxID=327740 RepID=UPI0024C20DBB|nr:G-protein coupled receptor 143-like [Hyla sarda]
MRRKNFGLLLAEDISEAVVRLRKTRCRRNNGVTFDEHRDNDRSRRDHTSGSLQRSNQGWDSGAEARATPRGVLRNRREEPRTPAFQCAKILRPSVMLSCSSLHGSLGAIEPRSDFKEAGLLLHSILSLIAPNFLTSQSWLSHITCVFISTWIHYFCSVLFWAFLCYSLEVDQFFRPIPSKRFGLLYSSLCWGASSLMILHGVLMLVIPPESQNRCDSKNSLVLFHDVLLYIPLLLALFGSPVLLRRAIVGVPSYLKMQCGVYTCYERFKQHALCRRLFQITGTFIACWLGNVLCDIMLLLVEVNSESPRQLQVAALTTFVIMGIMNPMFCCVHSLAFFGWRSSDACVTLSSTSAETPSMTSLDREDSALVEEENLLLRPKSVQATSILSYPNILQLMDSGSFVELTCSALEINAVRHLGKQDSPASCQTGSMF